MSVTASKVSIVPKKKAIGTSITSSVAASGTKPKRSIRPREAVEKTQEEQLEVFIDKLATVGKLLNINKEMVTIIVKSVAKSTKDKSDVDIKKVLINMVQAQNQKTFIDVLERLLFALAKKCPSNEGLAKSVKTFSEMKSTAPEMIIESFADTMMKPVNETDKTLLMNVLSKRDETKFFTASHMFIKSLNLATDWKTLSKTVQKKVWAYLDRLVELSCTCPVSDKHIKLLESVVAESMTLDSDGTELTQGKILSMSKNIGSILGVHLEDKSV